jgi:hypothetical protein
MGDIEPFRLMGLGIFASSPNAVGWNAWEATIMAN